MTHTYIRWRKYSPRGPTKEFTVWHVNNGKNQPICSHRPVALIDQQTSLDVPPRLLCCSACWKLKHE